MYCFLLHKNHVIQSILQQQLAVVVVRSSNNRFKSGCLAVNWLQLHCFNGNPLNQTEKTGTFA